MPSPLWLTAAPRPRRIELYGEEARNLVIAGVLCHGRITQAFARYIPLTLNDGTGVNDGIDTTYRERPSRDSSLSPSRLAVRGAASTAMTAARSQPPATTGNQKSSPDG